MERQYKNYAFISYKREDEKWAKWLQRKLESYKLPSVIRKESFNMPKYIRPVFRDKTDLSGGVLTEQLHNELERSKFLIVICSPNSAQSVWVNKEVQAFVDEERTEYIIPVIVDGVPHADSIDKECFPEVLRNIPSERELLGINVQEIGREKAFVRLVAYMIGVSFDTLWQRHQRQEKQKKIILAACFLLLMAFGIFYWDYTRATYEYYADYVDCWGVPKGVIKLSEEQVSHRHRCYQFEKRRIPFGEPNAYDWRLVKVSYVNSSGTAREHKDTEMQKRSSILFLEYSRETGSILRINHCNSFGRILVRHELSGRDNVPAVIVDLKGTFEETESGFASSRLNSLSAFNANKPNIKRYAYDRDKNGYVIRQTYHNSNLRDLSKSRTWDADGVAGLSFTLDSLGRPVRVLYLDENDTKVSIDNGVVGKVIEYDERGVVSKLTYVDVDDKPVLNEYLWATCLTISDSCGNIKEEHCYDEKGEPCMHKNGVSKIGYVYDEQGNRTGEGYFTADLTPCYDKTNRVFSCEYEYDAHGNIVLERFRDENGNVCYSREGYAIRETKYNSEGQDVKQEFFHADGRLCFVGEGEYTAFSKEYDSSGNHIKTSYFKIMRFENFFRFFNFGLPAASDDYGVHQEVAEYDSLNNLVKVYFLDENHQLYKHPEWGYAMIKFNYDSWGNRVGESYFDVDGNPCLATENNAASIQLVLDDNSNVIEEDFYGIDGALCKDKGGAAVYIYERDNRGRVIKRQTFDEEREPCLDVDGVAYSTVKYDSNSNPIETALFDLEGKLCECTAGYAIQRKKYDKRGNLIEETYYNKHGLPSKNMYGYAKMNIVYDNRDNEIENTFFDENGLMCYDLETGIARISYKYDMYDNCIERSYLDVDSNLCMNKLYNVAKVTHQYDKRGRELEQAYFDAEGLPCMPTGEYAVWKAEYNDWKMTRRVLYDDKGTIIEDSTFTPKAILLIEGDSIGEMPLM